MDNSLIINIYRRHGGRASLVFRKGSKIIHRVTTVEDAPAVVKALKRYEHDLDTQVADPEFVFEIRCPRNRNRILEIRLVKDVAVFCVYETANGAMDLCFKWCGSRSELKTSLAVFTVLAFCSKY